jgi:hypothetical protein
VLCGFGKEKDNGLEAPAAIGRSAGLFRCGHFVALGQSHPRQKNLKI